MTRTGALLVFAIFGAATICHGGGPMPLFVQSLYRWRNDDGGEALATWMANADTAVTNVAYGRNIRLRLAVANTGRGTGSLAPQLQYATSTDGPWRAVSVNANDPVAAFAMTASPWFANDAVTTPLLGGGDSFVAGRMVEAPTNASASVAYGTSQFSNFEYCFHPTPNALSGAAYSFRVSGAHRYDVYPRLTMAVLTNGLPPAIVSPLAASTVVGELFAYTLLASGSKPVAFGVSGLPADMAFDGVDGIEGVGLTPGIHPVRLTAVNAWGGATQTLALTISPVVPAPPNQTVWAQQPTITPVSAAAHTRFGSAVSLSGDRLAVGSSGENVNRGAVYVFTWNGSRWLQTARVTASDSTEGDRFGDSVSLSGNRLAVGAYSKAVSTNQQQGVAYVFDWNGASWVERGRLTASDGAANDHFGMSVSVNSNRLAVGASNKTIGGNSSAGRAYIYNWNGTNWLQAAALTAADNAAGDRFGASVSLGGNRVVVGAHGKSSGTGTAYVFDLSGANWNQTAVLTAADAAVNNFFGCAVALEGNRLVVGAHGRTTAGLNSAGAAYVFEWTGSAWTQRAVLTATDPGSGDQLGWAVALSGNRVLAGARSKWVFNAPGAGAAYAFDLSDATWRQTARLVAIDGANNDQFGGSVSLHGNRASVGAQNKAAGWHQPGGGAAYLFDLSAQHNTAPVANNQSVTAIAGGLSVPIPLSYTDPDPGQPRAFRLVLPPKRGTLDYFSISATSELRLPVPSNTWLNAERIWFYTPTGAGVGTDTFYWRVTDGIATSWVARVTVNIVAPSAPQAPPVFKAGVPLMDGANPLRMHRQVVGGAYDYAWRIANSVARLTTSPEVVDWNNDGLPDLLVGQARGRIALFINQGTRNRPLFDGYRELTFQDGSVICLRIGCNCHGSGPPCVAPRVVDWDNDGRRDLIVGLWGGGAYTYGNLRIIRNIGADGAPVFSPDSGLHAGHSPYVDYPILPSSGGSSLSPAPTATPFVTDINDDGIPDLISGQNSAWFRTSGFYGGTGMPSRVINIFLGTAADKTATESFVGGRAMGVLPTMTITNACPAGSRKSVVVADWTGGSGKKDLIVGMQDGAVWFSPNVGTPQIPSFTNHVRLHAGGVPMTIGDPALVGGDPGFNNNPGASRHNACWLIAGNEARLAVGDMDGDGLPDLVAGNADGFITVFYQHNPKPVALDQRVAVMPNHGKSIRLGAKVDSGRGVTFSVLTLPRHGVLSGVAPNLVYTPDPNYTGEDRFTFKARDGALESLPGTIFITVKRHPPVAQDQGTVLASMNRPRAIMLTAADEGDEPLTYSVVSVPRHGTWSIASNVLTYTSFPNYTGPDSFSWKANDGFLDSNVRTVTVDVAVLAVNFQPTNTPVPAGYLRDSGELFDAGRGYGWTRLNVMGGWMNLTHMGPHPVILNGNADPRIDTCILSITNSFWNCTLPNGNYHVTVGYGNYSQDGFQSRFQDRIVVQGITIVDNPLNIWGGPLCVVVDIPVAVTNGLLTVEIGGVTNTAHTRLNYLEIRRTPPSPSRLNSATFVGADTATQGDWHGVYGTDGHWIPNKSRSIPAYARVNEPSALIQTWADPTTDRRALQYPWSANRIASGWGSAAGLNNAIRSEIVFPDGLTRRVALYFLDWTGGGRNQTIDILSGTDTNRVLDTRTVSNFSGGQYLVWDITGHVTIRVWSPTHGVIMSGIFFGVGGNQDSNHDGLPDWWQIRHFGGIASLFAASGADLDGDGLTNLQEYLAGTDPTNPASYLHMRIQARDNGDITLGFDGIPGLIYDVYWKTNLVDASRWRYHTSIVGAGIPAQALFTNRLPQVFFQLRIRP